VREAGIVPDHRAAASLAAGHGLLQHHCPQALGRGVEPPDDAEQLEPGFLVLGPVGQELADFAVEILLEHPWLAEVVVSLA
jgi:hypothetical protein